MKTKEGKTEEMAKLPLLLLAGKSGSGKDTVARLICHDLSVKQVASYTTRPMREGEVNGVGHCFVSEAQYDEIAASENIVASTVFAGYRYCATEAQLNDAGIYIVDKKGIIDVKKNYEHPLLTIYLDTTDETRRERMEKRGDAADSIKRRIDNDKVMFLGIEEYCDIIYNVDYEEPNEIAANIELMLCRAARYTA